MIEVLKSKIHRVTVTDANLNYDGSISIASELLKVAGILEYQKVLVVDINNGQRFETYTIKSDKIGNICINGAAARLVNIGDKIIIMAFNYVENIEDTYKPTIVKVDEQNIVI